IRPVAARRRAARGGHRTQRGDLPLAPAQRPRQRHRAGGVRRGRLVRDVLRTGGTRMTPTADTADLSALAAGLCQDAGIGVELGPRWAWDAAGRVLAVAAPALRERGAAWSAPVLAHEVGHYFVPRHHLFAVPFPLPDALPLLMDGLEDPRANAWIVGR